METEYLKKCFGNCLAQALAEVVKVRPSDPIEYLAHWLYHYRSIAKAKEEHRQEKVQLKEERDSGLEEADVLDMLKQREDQTQQESEQDHTEPLSAKKAIFTREDTKLLEKEASEQEALPSTSSVILGMPSTESAGQSDRNFEMP
uniref:DPY30 domain-containing protein 2 n=1 Tax=Oryctolagus cuniculus TaxID=9986 RepID=G1SKQ3_RABIT|nr:DPY30 domain-containing protein 2 isoform X2 [Oryctolagus cuniculus]XP_051689010.1 DPY30 domain-containing protein 2 isoform X2 [Oryctolagus cuniculus]